MTPDEILRRARSVIERDGYRTPDHPAGPGHTLYEAIAIGAGVGPKARPRRLAWLALKGLHADLAGAYVLDALGIDQVPLDKVGAALDLVAMAPGGHRPHGTPWALAVLAQGEKLARRAQETGRIERGSVDPVGAVWGGCDAG